MSKNPTDSFLALVSYTGATVGTWFLNNALGIVVGIGGLAIQIYFNHRKDKREQRALELQEKALHEKDH
jgi:hypothetical protein